jgi:hypothetical protein
MYEAAADVVRLAIINSVANAISIAGIPGATELNKSK